MPVHTLDLGHLGRRERIASYLVTGGRRPVLVEAGPSSCLETLVAALAAHGVAPPDVSHVFVTHIHLDHAGAAGWWGEQGAAICVHPRGARHLADPSRLVASATRLYGRLMDELWGEVRPVPAGRIRIVKDGEVVDLGGPGIEALDTPGHAGHHHAWALEREAFVGDLAAIVVPGTELVELPTPPPEFDPELWTTSLERVAARGFATIYPTHFGPLENVADHLGRVGRLVAGATAAVAASLERGADRLRAHADFAAWRRAQNAAAGADPEQLAALDGFNPPAPSCAGILRYLEKSRGRVPARAAARPD